MANVFTNLNFAMEKMIVRTKLMNYFAIWNVTRKLNFDANLLHIVLISDGNVMVIEIVVMVVMNKIVQIKIALKENSIVLLPTCVLILNGFVMEPTTVGTIQTNLLNCVGADLANRIVTGTFIFENIY